MTRARTPNQTGNIPLIKGSTLDILIGLYTLQNPKLRDYPKGPDLERAIALDMKTNHVGNNRFFSGKALVSTEEAIGRSIPKVTTDAGFRTDFQNKLNDFKQKTIALAEKEKELNARYITLVGEKNGVIDRALIENRELAEKNVQGKKPVKPIEEVLEKYSKQLAALSTDYKNYRKEYFETRNDLEKLHRDVFLKIKPQDRQGLPTPRIESEAPTSRGLGRS